jgi:arginyl-tRNA---protein transferase
MLLYSDGGIPFVLPPEDTDALADWLEAEYPDEFCASVSFDEDFVDSLCASGFITMAASDEGEYLIPKMHTIRSVMHPREIAVTRTARRESSHYTLSVDERFGEVLDACVATHGEDWLRPPLRECWTALYESRPLRRSRFASMELYADGRLEAGEIGVFAGSCYTSLTGFRREPGAGTVQLAATARYLEACGIGLWDLGMPLDYKASLGAHNVSRAEFLALFRAARSAEPRHLQGPFPARGLIDHLAIAVGDADEGPT